MLIERKDMTTPISTTPTLNLNLVSATPRVADATKAENQTEKPLSPDTQKALKRFIPNNYALFGLNNKGKLIDYLADPYKNANNALNLFGSVLSGAVFLATLGGVLVNPQFAKSLKQEKSPLFGMSNLAGLGLETALIVAGTLFDWQYKPRQNKDLLKGINTLGEGATLEEWQNYKKTHPELKQA
jgi:hypothetical protein